jgi:hypothetical protein
MDSTILEDKSTQFTKNKDNSNNNRKMNNDKQATKDKKAKKATKKSKTSDESKPSRNDMPVDDATSNSFTAKKSASADDIAIAEYQKELGKGKKLKAKTTNTSSAKMSVDEEADALTSYMDSIAPRKKRGSKPPVTRDISAIKEVDALKREQDELDYRQSLKPKTTLKDKKKKKKAATEDSKECIEDSKECTEIQMTHEESMQAYEDQLRRENEEIILRRQAKVDAKKAKADAKLAKAQLKQAKADAKARIERKTLADINAINSRNDMNQTNVRASTPNDGNDDDNLDFENEEIPSEEVQESVPGPRIITPIASNSPRTSSMASSSSEFRSPSLALANSGSRIGFGIDRVSDNAPFKHLNMKEAFVSEEHLSTAWLRDRNYNESQRSNAIRTCRVKTKFVASEVRARMLAEEENETKEGDENSILNTEQQGIFAMLAANRNGEMFTEETLLESWDLVLSVIVQTKFVLSESKVDDSKASSDETKAIQDEIEYAEKKRKAADMCSRFIKALKMRMKSKTAKKNSGKNSKPVQIESVDEIRAKVNLALEQRVIDSDRNQLQVLMKTAKGMRNLSRVGAHTKQLSTRQKVDEALLAIWPTLSGDQPMLQKNIFVEIFNVIGSQGIADMTGSTGQSLRRFHQTFTLSKLIDFSFEFRGDVMEPFSPLWNTPHQLETFQTEAIDMIDAGNSVVISAPTSSGKTFVALYCIQDDKLTLMLYPTDELAKQAAGTIRNQQSKHGGHTPIMYISGLEVIRDKGARVVIGTPANVFNYFMTEGGMKVSCSEEEIIEDFDTYGTPEHDTFASIRVQRLTAFNTIVLDEFQQLNGVSEGYQTNQGNIMQQIMLLCKDAQFIVLSATIRNIEQVVKWIDYISGRNNAKSVTYTERFINQERWCYTGQNIEKVSCLGVVTVPMIQDGCLTRSEMQFPPKQLPDLGRMIYDTVAQMLVQAPIVEGVDSPEGNEQLLLIHPYPEIDPNVYFAERKITLKECKRYEDLLKVTLTAIARTHPDVAQDILNPYLIQNINIEKLSTPELYEVLYDLKQRDMLSAMVFIFDQIMCRKTCYDLVDYMIAEEFRQFPYRKIIRELQNKMSDEFYSSKADKGSKKISSNSDGSTAKEDAEDRAEGESQAAVQAFIKIACSKIDHGINQWKKDLANPAKIEEHDMLRKRIHYNEIEKRELHNMETLCEINEFAPHPMFTFGNITVSKDMMRSIKQMMNPEVDSGKKTKKGKTIFVEKKDSYRPPIGWKSRFMLCAERGITFSTKYMGECDARFQGLMQTMLEKFGVQVVFADESLAIGVNLPITTTVLYNPVFADEGIMDIPVILAHQAQGRGGRRGLDTKGFVVYVGVEHERLMLGEYLDIRGHNIIEKFTSLPVRFNTKFPVSRLSKLSMRQFYDLEDPTDTEAIHQIELANRQLLIDSIHVSFSEVTASPMQMFRLLRVTPYANLIQDFFSFIGERSYTTTINLENFDLVNMMSSMLFPNIMQEEIVKEGETKYKPSRVLEKFIPMFNRRCLALGKEYQFGKYSNLAVSVRADNADDISMNELHDLKHICDIMDVLCSNNKFATVGWKEMMIKCHMKMCNLIFVMCI